MTNAAGQTWLEEAMERDRRDVRAYAARFVNTLGRGGQTWENMAPLIRNGWAVRHDQVCVARHDWRLSWPAAREGWRESGGAFDPPNARIGEVEWERPKLLGAFGGRR